ncbi:MAG: hypothetical protein RLZZ67_465 [Candidatus Parcubacteria bacterium]|jgi:hypothetical protein
MNLAKLNKQLVTFCAVGLLFLGSLYYLVSTAFNTSDSLNSRQLNTQTVNDYLKDL